MKNLIPAKSQVQMQRLDENIFYVQAKINADDLEDKADLKYSYIKYGTQDTLDQNEESEQEKTKGKKFLRLGTFFDTFAPKKFTVMQQSKTEGQEPFIKFFLSHATKLDKHFGTPKIFDEYNKYLYEDGA
jgi:hypothetical protein